MITPAQLQVAISQTQCWWCYLESVSVHISSFLETAVTLGSKQKCQCILPMSSHSTATELIISSNTWKRDRLLFFLPTSMWLWRTNMALHCLVPSPQLCSDASGCIHHSFCTSARRSTHCSTTIWAGTPLFDCVSIGCAYCQVLQDNRTSLVRSWVVPDEYKQSDKSCPVCTLIRNFCLTGESRDMNSLFYGAFPLCCGRWQCWLPLRKHGHSQGPVSQGLCGLCILSPTFLCASKAFKFLVWDTITVFSF